MFKLTTDQNLKSLPSALKHPNRRTASFLLAIKIRSKFLTQYTTPQRKNTKFCTIKLEAKQHLGSLVSSLWIERKHQGANNKNRGSLPIYPRQAID